MSPAVRLIGRESALAAAGAVLGDALGGSGQFLMISGEAGIGKTALLAALTGQAGPVPLVLRGFCWEGEGAPPYWPWSQVLRASGVPMADLGEAEEQVVIFIGAVFDVVPADIMEGGGPHHDGGMDDGPAAAEQGAVPALA